MLSCRCAGHWKASPPSLALSTVLQDLPLVSVDTIYAAPDIRAASAKWLNKHFIADRLRSRGVNALERLATAVDVARQQPDANPADRAQALVGLKPHIPFAGALAAVQEADCLFVETGQQFVG